MYAVRHGLLKAKRGEKVHINFNVVDQSGLPVSLSGASATYRIGRRVGEQHLLQLTSNAGQIVFSNNIASVAFSVDDIQLLSQPQTGDLFGQLFITKDTITLVVAEGPIHISDIIQ